VTVTTNLENESSAKYLTASRVKTEVQPTSNSFCIWNIPQTVDSMQHNGGILNSPVTNI